MFLIDEGVLENISGEGGGGGFGANFAEKYVKIYQKMAHFRKCSAKLVDVSFLFEKWDDFWVSWKSKND